MCKIFRETFFFSRFFFPRELHDSAKEQKRLKCADRLNQSKIHILQVCRFSSLVADENARNGVKLVNHSPLSRRSARSIERRKCDFDLRNKTSENKVYDSKFRPHSQSALKSAVVCWFCTRANDSTRLWRKMNFLFIFGFEGIAVCTKSLLGMKLSLRHPKIGSKADSGQHISDRPDDFAAVHPCARLYL